MKTKYQEWLQEIKKHHCNCGSPADVKEAIYGTCHGKKAKWAGCIWCTGTAVGPAYIYQE